MSSENRLLSVCSGFYGYMRKVLRSAWLVPVAFLYALFCWYKGYSLATIAGFAALVYQTAKIFTAGSLFFTGFSGSARKENHFPAAPVHKWFSLSWVSSRAFISIRRMYVVSWNKSQYIFL